MAENDNRSFIICFECKAGTDDSDIIDIWNGLVEDFSHQVGAGREPSVDVLRSEGPTLSNDRTGRVWKHDGKMDAWAYDPVSQAMPYDGTGQVLNLRAQFHHYDAASQFMHKPVANCFANRGQLYLYSDQPLVKHHP